MTEDVFAALCNNHPLPDLPRYRREAALSLALVRALAEGNRMVFSLAQKELNDLATMGVLAVPSSFKHRDARAAVSVAQEINFLPKPMPGHLPPEFEKDFIRIWSLSAQLDNLTLFDDLLSHAVRLDITPLRCVQVVFNGKNDVIRWDLYNHLAQRNQLNRLKKLESHFNYLENILLNVGSSDERNINNPMVFLVCVISESVKSNSWDTFEWLANMAAVNPSSNLVQMTSGMCLRAPRSYLNKMFEVFPANHVDIFNFFDDTDKSGQSTERLECLLTRVDCATDECLNALVSSVYPRNTARRRAIAARAESLLQQERLSRILENGSERSAKIIKM